MPPLSRPMKSGMTTLDSILAAAEAHPDRTAFRFPDGSLTCGGLVSRACALADRFSAEDGPVVMNGERTVGAAVTILACLMASRPYVPLAPDLPSGRRAAILARLEASPLPRDTAYVIFTSGSTGEPKGVPISRRNLDAFTAILPRWFGEEDGLTVFGAAPFSFDLSAADFYYALCGGHTLVSPDRQDPAGALSLLGTADAAVMTPTYLRLLLPDPAFSPAACPRLRILYLCGETLLPTVAAKVLDRFPGLALLNAYGPTEATSAVSAVRITGEMTASGDPLPVGEIGNTTARIRIADGEIALVGPSVFGGYLGDIRGGCFRENGENGFMTGDLGSVEDGRIYCRGRRDGQIKYKGYRIETGDVEAHLAALPGIRECAVVPKRKADGTVLSLVAFVVPEDGSAPAPAAIRAELSDVLPDYMIPKSVRLLDRLPVTPNGKTDRKALIQDA